MKVTVAMIIAIISIIGCSTDPEPSKYPETIFGTYKKQSKESINYYYYFKNESIVELYIYKAEDNECNFENRPYNHIHWQWFEAGYTYNNITGWVEYDVDTKLYESSLYPDWEYFMRQSIVDLDSIGELFSMGGSFNWNKDKNPELNGLYVNDDSWGTPSVQFLHVSEHRSGLGNIFFNESGLFFIESDLYRDFDPDIPALIEWCGNGSETEQTSQIWNNQLKIQEDVRNANQFLELAKDAMY